MKAVLLDGAGAKDTVGKRVCGALSTQLRAQGWDVDHVTLREQEIGNCGGEFSCWVKHPGACMWDDDNRVIAAALANSDLAVYLTPVTFGGYSSTLKRMVDHQIQNISPFFKEIEGETHHHKRYKANPDLLAVGWMDAPDGQAEAVFHHLVRRNALNWYAKTCVSDVVLSGQSEEALQAVAQEWLSDVQNGRSSQRVELPTSEAPPTAFADSNGDGAAAVRRALLLVGSPKQRKSTSHSLGGYMYEQLSARSIHTEAIYVHSALRSAERTQALLAAVDAADLVTLSFPLYVDSLPAPATEALELIAAHRQERNAARRQLFAAIANCGYPEAHHCAPALAICALFAQQAGFEWAGGLALGGGGMINGTPLVEGGGKTLLMRNALDLAAEALAEGRAVPNAAQDLFAKPLIPPWTYRLMSRLGWVLGAREHNAIRLLRRRPYRAKAR
jgi:multimeric flavodoxin WrbA